MPRRSVRTPVPPPAKGKVSDASRFQLLVQGVTDYALYMLSAEGVVISWNAGAERMKGYTPDEIIGRHFSQFFTGEDRDAGLPQKALADRAAGRPLRVRRLAGPQGRHQILGLRGSRCHP